MYDLIVLILILVLTIISYVLQETGGINVWKGLVFPIFTYLGGMVLLASSLIIIGVHTISENNNMYQFEELSEAYQNCKESESISCATIQLKVIEWNKNLKMKIHYNQYFDMFHSDDVIELGLIE